MRKPAVLPHEEGMLHHMNYCSKDDLALESRRKHHEAKFCLIIKITDA